MVLPWPPKAHCDLQRFEDIGKQKLRQTHHELDSISIVSAPCAGPLSRTDHKYIHHINTSLHPQATYSETRDWPVNWLHPKAWQFSSQSCAFIVFHCSRTPGFGKRMTSGLAAMGSESRCRMKTIDIVDHTYEANYVSRKTRAQRSHLPGVLVRLGISKDNVSQCLPFIATGNGKTTNCLRSLFLQCPMTFKSVFPQISSLTWDWHHRTMSALGSNTLGSTLASITSFLRWRSLSPLIQVSSSQNWIENLEIAPWNPTKICHAQYIVTLCTNPLRKSTSGICLTITSDKARTRRCGEVDVGMGKCFIEQRLQGCGNISALERGTKPKHLDPETRKNSTKGKTKIIRLCKCVPAHHRIAPWQTQPDQISAGCSADSFARPLAHDTQKELGRDHDIVWAPNQFRDHYLNLKLLIAWYWQGKAMHPGTPIHHIDRTW